MLEKSTTMDAGNTGMKVGYASTKAPGLDDKGTAAVSVNTTTQKMVAATVGSVLTASVGKVFCNSRSKRTNITVTPFDVVRVRMQNQEALIHESGAQAIAPGRKITGTWTGLRTIAKYEGFTTLFRGLNLTLLMVVPSNVGYFVGYEYMRDHSPIKSDVFTPLFAGGIARTLVATAASPVELIKTRIQTISAASRGEAFSLVMGGVKSMIKVEGVTSLWKGLVLTLWRDVPFSGIYWMSVEMMKRRLSQTSYFRKHPEHNLVQSFIAGVTGGVTAAIFTAPFDVGKTRRQVGSQSSKFANMRTLQILTTIARTEGFSALYVGAVPRILKVAPASALMITTYDTVKKLYGNPSP